MPAEHIEHLIIQVVIVIRIGNAFICFPAWKYSHDHGTPCCALRPFGVAHDVVVITAVHGTDQVILFQEMPVKLSGPLGVKCQDHDGA